ncbi:hypothetical protein LNQ03_11950 [Klebsiella pneumoniae subsp. pneumoniae]|nr:hypothetical protein [Klebsiella pneumoniae subsp. pneumoniae]
MKRWACRTADVFRQAKDVAESTRGFSLAQKMVGRACVRCRYSSGRLLRTENDLRRFSGHHRSNDP